MWMMLQSPVTGWLRKLTCLNHLYWVPAIISLRIPEGERRHSKLYLPQAVWLLYYSCVLNYLSHFLFVCLFDAAQIHEGRILFFYKQSFILQTSLSCYLLLEFYILVVSGGNTLLFFHRKSQFSGASWL